MVKNPPANAGATGLIPALGRSLGEANGNPLPCSCLENPRDGGPGSLPSMGLHRVRHDLSDLAAAAAAVFLWPSSLICK